MAAAKQRVGVASTISKHINGAVFEVRQGYKSRDSKREKAYMATSVDAYQEFLLPVVLLLSTQIDEAVAERYHAGKWLLLVGTTAGSATDSTYAFCREVVCYDLAAFFERNATAIKAEIENVLKALLKP